MTREISHNIKLLSEKLDLMHEVKKESVVLKNDNISVNIRQKDALQFQIEYSNYSDSYKRTVDLNLIYDFLIDVLLEKDNLKTIAPKTGVPLTIEKWIEIEGDFAEEQLKKLHNEIERRDIEFKELGGNVIEAVYFKGVIFLTDVLCETPSNIVQL